jgi:hypothetical protein
MRFTPNAVVGIGIALLGTALLLDRLEIVAIGRVLQFWPVLLILFGASVAVQALRGGNGNSGRAQRPIVTPGFVLFLVIISFVFSNAYERSSVARSNTNSERVATFNVLGRDYRASHSTRFRGAEMTNVMGGSRNLPESAEAVTPEATTGTAEAPPDTSQAPADAPPRVVLRGVVMMGAIEIRS